MQKNIFKVSKPSKLMEFLIENMPEKSRKAVKSLLSHKMISVDGRAVTQFDHPLKPGQEVTVNAVKTFSENIKGLKILYDDESLIVIDKESGLLSVASENEKEKTAYRILSDNLKKNSPDGKIFAVHRLDRDTSGVMMYAKSALVRDELQENWETIVIDRIYIAVIEGSIEKPEGRIISWLKENKNLAMYSSKIPGDGQKAVTTYKMLKKNDKFSLIELRLETGRKNQIRVHMKDIGHPIAGDLKYGSSSNPLRRLCLHAYKLSFIHPVTKKEMSFTSKIPYKFSDLFIKKK